LAVAVALLTAAPAIAADKPQATKLEPVKVKSLQESLKRAGTLKDVIEKTEVIDAQDMKDRQAGTLYEAVKDQPGITVNTECSMCGIKRVQINGMKGEHTTVLVDGVPIHSVVSSYYGMDALATAGVSRIEVARGAGASLLAPEAIGGTLNIILDKPTRTGFTTDLAGGTLDYRRYSVVGTALTDDGKLGLLGIGQYDNIDQEDADDNKVNEAPRVENYSLTFKAFYDITSDDQFQFRVTKIKSDVHGGYMSDNYEAVRQDPGDPAFEGGDVRNKYTGAKLGTCEYITTEREELTGQWLHRFNDRLNMVAIASYAHHGQDSVYEGFDYHNKVPTYYGSFKLNYALGKHLITTGVSGRYEELRSDSVQVEADPELVPDDYDYSDYAVFIQDTWRISPSMELIAAVRVDKITVDWTAQTAEDNEIDLWMVAPRLHFRWNHTPQLASRVSLGRGYRSPLTFFESEHGLLEDGFNVDIDELEKSWSAGYSLSYEGKRLSVTGSLHYTIAEDLAYIDADNYDRPTLVNSQDDGEVWAFDVVSSYKLTSWLSVGASYEQYIMSDDYKKTFGIAPIEQRIGLFANLRHEGWNFVTYFYWIGSRDLEDYGYEAWNAMNPETGELSAEKDTDAPSYFTVDMKLEKELGQHFALYVGVKNLFDYTQAGDEDSPLMWDADGGYDVGYIYGPLRGRLIYAGLKVTF
jgi:outer membrane receptor for ferrienterochelin and colicin